MMGSAAADAKNNLIFTGNTDHSGNTVLKGFKIPSGKNVYSSNIPFSFNLIQMDPWLNIIFGLSKGGVYALDTSKGVMNKIVDLPQANTIYFNSESYDPISKRFLFESDSTSIRHPDHYLYAVDIKNKKLLFKLNLDSTSASEYKYDFLRNKYYCIHYDSKYNKWLAECDSAFQPHDIARLYNKTTINEISSFYNPYKQVYYYLTSHNPDYYLTSMDVTTGKIKDSVLLPGNIEFLEMMVDSSGDAVTGLLNNLNSPALKVYPNPSGGFVHIQIPQHIKNCSFRLLNINGKQLYLPGELVERSGNECIINMTSFPRGSYILQMVNEQKIYNAVVILK
jgi:hypothetical protein